MMKPLRPQQRVNQPALYAILGLTVLVGIVIVATRAAGPQLNFEAESGVLAGPAQKTAQANASGGQAVRFATSTPTPTSTPVPTASPTPVSGRTCTNPVFTTSDTNGGWSNGGYYVHNNMWNASTGETLYACAYNNWYVEAQGYTGTSVKTYPNVHLDLPNAFTTGVPFNNYSSITTNFAGRGPGAGIYNVAYDLWLNGVGWGGGSTEVMIWTEYLTQRPLGSIKTTYTAGGVTYDVWHYNDGDANVVSYVARGNLFAGTIDLKAIVNFGISKGYIPANPSLNQIGYGIEFCSTAGAKQRFTVTDFSITLK